VNAEFNWWLLIVGVVAGAGLAWLVLADSVRRDREISDEEVPAEAAWIAGTLADGELAVRPDQAEAVLRAHRTYLGFPPPDALVDPEELRPTVGAREAAGAAEAEVVPEAEAAGAAESEAEAGAAEAGGVTDVPSTAPGATDRPAPGR
jgi:hypothetical protein